MEILFLSRREIASLVKEEEVIEVVEEIFRDYEREEAIMPPKVYLFLPEYEGDFRAMPSYWKRKGYAGIKWVNAHFKNPLYSLPSVMAIFLLNEAKTGKPLAALEMGYLTSLRTAAGAVISSRYLAPPSVKKLGMIGLGEQSYYLFKMHLLYFPIEEVWIYDIKKEQENRFQEKIRPFYSGKIYPSSLEEVVKKSEILITATPSREPFVKEEWVKASSLFHINAIGADAKGKKEIESSLIRKCKVIVDDRIQASHGGEIQHAIEEGVFKEEDIYATLGEILLGKKPSLKEDLTLFDSTGLSIQDIAVASLVYERAKEKGIGTKISLF